MADLTPTARDVLLDLRPRLSGGNGDNIQSNIIDNTGRSTKAVSTALEYLEDRGLVTDKGRGVYRLTDRGRDLADQLSELDDSL